nr:hypothetical protein [Pandoravirus massiliensis]
MSRIGGGSGANSLFQGKPLCRTHTHNNNGRQGTTARQKIGKKRQIRTGHTHQPKGAYRGSHPFSFLLFSFLLFSFSRLMCPKSGQAKKGTTAQGRRVRARDASQNRPSSAIPPRTPSHMQQKRYNPKGRKRRKEQNGDDGARREAPKRGRSGSLDGTARARAKGGGRQEKRKLALFAACRGTSHIYTRKKRRARALCRLSTTTATTVS